MTTQRHLVLCAHGTGAVEGQATIQSFFEALEQRIRGNRPEILQVKLAFVDVQQPDLADVLVELADDNCREIVILPLFLARGFHIRTDIPAAIEKFNAKFPAHTVLVADSLGPSQDLAAVLANQITAWPDLERCILVSAGSSDPRAIDDVRTAAKLIAEQLPDQPAPDLAFLSSGEPQLEDLLSSGDSRDVLLLPYLLAPGFFFSKLERIANQYQVQISGQALLNESPDRLVESLLNRIPANHA